NIQWRNFPLNKRNINVYLMVLETEWCAMSALEKAKACGRERDRSAHSDALIAHAANGLTEQFSKPCPAANSRRRTQETCHVGFNQDRCTSPAHVAPAVRARSARRGACRSERRRR